MDDNELIEAAPRARKLAYVPYSKFTVAGGRRDFTAITIVTESKKPAAPCRACRQVWAEFSPNLKVLAATVDSDSQHFELSKAAAGASTRNLGEN
jgi:cytidine deaminase